MPQRLVISCFYLNRVPDKLPVGLQWAQDLLTHFPNKYRITLLLHGQCLSLGLNSPGNTFLSILKALSDSGFKIVICELCLKQTGHNNRQLLPFVKPIAFSVDYLAEAQTGRHKAVVIYDAQA